MKVLVTGGAGYIGSTICSALIDNGHTPIILDSLITGKLAFTKDKIFYKGDITDRKLLEKIFSDNPDIKCAIHCAALVVVAESVTKPYDYYYENVVKSLELFKNLNEIGCKNIVFSSSASIYNDAEDFMVTEESSLNPRSPYARTKYIIEMMLKDICDAYGMKGIALRYFNPIGADPKMRSGVHVDNPTHVLGKLVQVATGKEAVFKITGTNWNTRDGSGIRDYIHVWDLALAHVKAIEKFDDIFTNPELQNKCYAVINIGSGDGVTVKELVQAFEKVYKKEINKVEAPSRLGDVIGSYTNADKALRLLDWKTELSVEQGIHDALKWAKIKDSVLNEE